MIDLKLLREDPDAVRASQRARGEDPELVDTLLTADSARRAAIATADRLRAEHKALGRIIGSAPPALSVDQFPDTRRSVSDDAGGAADGGGDDLEIDNDETQIEAFEARFQQNIRTHLFRAPDRLLDGLHVGETDGDAPPLLAARGFDDDRAVFLDERPPFRGIIG